MKKLLKLIAILVGGFFLLVIALAVFVGDKSAGQPGASGASTPAAATAPSAPPIAVSAGALFDAYHANEVAADQQYKGKTLQVSGTVQSINKDAFDKIYVLLRSSNEFMGVHASLSDEALAASLKKGQKVAWTCKGAGMLVGSPILRDCQP